MCIGDILIEMFMHTASEVVCAIERLEEITYKEHSCWTLRSENKEELF